MHMLNLHVLAACTSSNQEDQSMHQTKRCDMWREIAPILDVSQLLMTGQTVRSPVQ